jgi:hypothetical protein
MIKYLHLCYFIPLSLLGKTLVFTTGFNRPDFIELQYRLLDKFLEDDYEYTVVNDANMPATKLSIEDTCLRLNIACINVPQEIHTLPYLPRNPGDNYSAPNVRHCNAVQWAWDNYFSKYDGPVMVIDSDMFPIRRFSVQNLLRDHHFAAVSWGTDDIVNGQPYSYLWLGLILFNNEILPERETLCFNCGKLPNTNAICDSGGWTNLYLNKFQDILKIHELSFIQGHQFYCPYRYASVEAQNFNHISNEMIIADLRNRGFTENEIQLALKKPYTIELIGNNTFLHYRSGTNYENYSKKFLSQKDKILCEFFEKILELPREQ